MVDEKSARRSSFVKGTEVLLANGQVWDLPGRYPDRDDPEYDGTLLAIFEAEDRSERLRAELALAILLLSRNYNLAPADYQAILSYRPDDPALGTMQRAVHELALDHALRYEAVIKPRPEPRAEVAEWDLPPAKQPARVRSGWSLF